jgi:hypothetical protein
MRKILPFMLFLLFGVLWLVDGAEYKFGLEEKQYPELFANRGGRVNRVIKFNERYSWLTELPVGTDVVRVEHCVIATEEDQQRVGLTAGCYLFSSIQFDSPKVSSVRFDLTYNAQPLETAGVFIFRSHRLKDGQIDHMNQGWEIVPQKGDVISQTHPFGYVKFSKVPGGCRLATSLPQALWFPAPLEERIVVSAEDGKVFEFKLMATWHKATNFWWKILTIT